MHVKACVLSPDPRLQVSTEPMHHAPLEKMSNNNTTATIIANVIQVLEEAMKLLLGQTEFLYQSSSTKHNYAMSSTTTIILI